MTLAPRRRRKRPWLLLGVAAFVTTGAAAAYYGTQPGTVAPVAAIEAATTEREPTRSATVSPKKIAPPSSKTEEPDSAPAASAAAVAASPKAAPTPSDPVAKPSADELLSQASTLRGQGSWAAAEAAYTRVLREFPGTPQSCVATMAAASLRLDHLKDTRGALRLYQGAARGGLAQEAQYGVARCHRALGNSGAEAAALRRLLASGPSAFLESRAKTRLAQLEGKPAEKAAEKLPKKESKSP